MHKALTCPACQLLARPTTTTVKVRAREGQRHITIGRIPAGECPRCEATVMDPALRAHLWELTAELGVLIAPAPAAEPLQLPQRPRRAA